MAIESQISRGDRQREIFIAALEIEHPAARRRFLEGACGADRLLLDSVEQLLNADQEAGQFLQAPALARPPDSGPGGAAMLPQVTEQAGDRIGRYKLLQKIGEGGCGVVYMADQEEPVRRRVAVKILKLGMDTKRVIARFEAERQALAMMEHSNIAKVLDAGATDAGRPYFVMELVRGIRITDYCDQNKLKMVERLKLFVQVCHAIQHAHQKGIIHRDIKPSNILVTLHDGVPVPKVIDFGIAKATEYRLTDKTVFTEFAMFLGTPAYMSPEQAALSGLDTDTRSDIYSLGVLLYELLTGKPPFDPETLLAGGLDECRRTIREQEPERPSTRLATMMEGDLTTAAGVRRIEASQLIHLLSGDVDWIVMKCLEKDRRRRYAAASDLAQDVQRYLDGEAVLARPPSSVYRFKKFVCRHRAAFIASTAVAMTLTAGIAVSGWLALRATQAEQRAVFAQRQETELRRQAEAERARAEQEKASARLNEYVAGINLAQQSLAAGNLGRAIQLLNRHAPPPGEPDLRGFEWRYLSRLCEGDAHEQLPAQEGPVHAMAISPGGEWLALGVRDKCHVWDLRSRTLAATLSTHVISMAFSSDGRTLTTVSPTTTRAWETAGWTLQRTGKEGGSLGISRDGALLAIPRRQGVRLVENGSSREIRFLPRASSPAVFSPDTQKLVTDTPAGLTLWSLDGDAPGRLLEDSASLFSRSMSRLWSDRVLAFSPNGTNVVAARNSLSSRGVFVLSVWDAETGEEIAVMPGEPDHVEHTGWITAVAFSPDGRTLATASMDYSIRLWNFETRQRTVTLQGHLAEVWALTFSPDGRTLISGAKDGGVKLWQLEEPAREELIAGPWMPMGFSSDSKTLAALNPREGQLVFFNLAAGDPDRQFQIDQRRGRSGPFTAAPVALSGDLQVIVQGMNNGNVKLLNTETGKDQIVNVSTQRIEFVALSPDGTMLIAGGGRQPLTWHEPGAGTSGAVGTRSSRGIFSPDSRMFAAFEFGGVNGVELWETATRATRTNLLAEAPPAFAAAFSPDSRLLAVIYQDDVIRFWDAESGALVGACTGHKQGVLSVAFSPDGKTLASSSDDSTLKLWNVATQQELLSIRRLGGPVRALLFAPDGSFLVGSSMHSSSMPTSGGVRFYRAPYFEPKAHDAPSPKHLEL
jgi:eukaryotic-like serine/threonine-protein kinase